MLAILSTHPIQYQVPLWQRLAADGRVPFEVWYFTDFGVRASRDAEFGKSFSWDIDMLSGYTHRFLDVETDATPTSFWKCRLRESLRDRIRAAGVTAVWLQGWQVAAYWQAVSEAKAAGAQVWLRAESNDLRPVPAWKRPLKRVQLGWLFGRVDCFLYIGAANKRLYEKYGAADEDLFPAPYAIDNERFARQAAALRPERMALRRAWGIPDDATCVLFCGKLIAKKRPMDLVHAARKIAAAGRARKIHLLFAGSGELEGDLRAATRGGPPASFAGFLNQTEISRAYVAADCLALPSDHGETWGLVVNEAIASGLPCIVSDACGCAEDIARVAGCARVPKGDIDALAEAILNIGGVAMDAEAFTRHFSFAVTTETVTELARRK